MSKIRKLDWKKITPINDNVLVALEQEEEIKTDSGIILTQLHKPKNHFRILKISDKVYMPELEANTLVFCKRINKAKENLYCIDRDQQIYLIPFSFIVAFYDRDHGLVPIGRRILIRRRVENEIDPNTKLFFHRSEKHKTQTRMGNIIAFGELEIGEEWNTPMEVGNLVHVDKWSPEHIEIELPNHTYGLIVEEKDISYIEYGNENMLEFDHLT